MIFFNIPSVGQLKAETFFGSDDHYGFISTLFAETYDRSKIRENCAKYYGKSNLKYWDQIITLVNAIGVKRLDQHERLTNIPLVDYVAAEYDKENHMPAKLLFQFYLLNWQFPHPILTKKSHAKHEKLDLVSKNLRYDYDYVKPYPLVLKILNSLSSIEYTQSYLRNDEFYWLFSEFLRQGKGFDINNYEKIATQIYEMRSRGGWEKYIAIENDNGTKTHLSYPRGFLKNSELLTDDNYSYNVDKKDFFIGLNQEIESSIVKNEISLSSERFFEFDRSIKPNDFDLNNKFSFYMNDEKFFRKWIAESNLHNINLNQLFFERPLFIIGTQDNFARQLERLNLLDKKSVSKSRTEQHILRKYLFKDDTMKAKCCLCNKELPINLLTAAHIKKREDCDETERKDLNVVMPACNLGCDILYEKGYIFVNNGIIKANIPEIHSTDDLSNHVKQIKDTACNYWNDKNKRYFEFHEKKHS